MKKQHDEHRAVVDPVWANAEACPTRLACIDLASDEKWTYSKLDSDIQRAVRVLTDHNVCAGTRVAVIAPNSVHMIILQQALLRLGACLIPLSWRLATPELARILQDCNPKLLFADRALEQLESGCQQFLISSFAKMVRQSDPMKRLEAISLSQQQPSLILYTSGTSGTPKGVMLTPRCLVATAINFSALGEVESGSAFLCDSPMFHVIGMVTQIWPALLQGGVLVVSPAFDAEKTNQRLADPRLSITHYFCVPQMADALRRATNFEPGAWKSLKALFTGGAPNPAARIHWWLDRGIRMVDGYGMTETGTTLGMRISTTSIRLKAGSVGFPGPLTQVRIVDTGGKRVADDVPGEIQVSGWNVCSGYLNNVDATRQAFTEDGWFRTGDVGRRDADGFIYIMDRRKEIYISGGENVYPTEVETALLSHPSVQEAAVIGVPDEKWGEVGLACIIAVEGKVTHDELAMHCKGLIAGYKVPKHFVFASSIPRTGSGKIMKNTLRDQIQLGQRIG